MKAFFEVLLIAATLILLSFGQIGLSIFTWIAFLLLVSVSWYSSSYKCKTVDEIIAEADGESFDSVYVEYHFIAEPTEKFTDHLHHYSTGKVSEADLLPKLAELITEHTGVPISADRLHITKIQPLHSN